MQQGFLTSEPFAIQKAGVKANTFLFADHGWPSYGTTISCLEETVKNRSKVVASFVRGTMERLKSIYNCATPVDDERMLLVQWLYRNDSEASCSTAELIAWDAAITAEDRDILEATDADACIDTTRKMEFHMPSDKPGPMIRQQLLALLRAHGEEEVHRGSPAMREPARIPIHATTGASLQ